MLAAGAWKWVISMQVVQATVGNNGLVGEVVTSQHHGVNMLFHSDDVAVDSDLRDVVQAIGATMVRYPGGTIAEEYFDLANPDLENTPNVVDILHGSNSVRVRQDVVTLSEYLSYSAELDGDPVIVLPTYRYFDADTGGVSAGTEQIVKTFIRDVLTDQYGQVDSLIVELGNEFYQSRFEWTDSQFAALQAQIGEWVNDEASALGLRGNITILAQAGRSVSENHMLASHFMDADGPSIDGVVTHLYGTNSSGNPLGIGGGIGRRLEDINDTWSTYLGPDFDLAVTEWNVGESGPLTSQINGLMRSAPLLRIYAEMIENGVDIATIWAAQTSGPAGLSRSEGNGSDLSPTGYLYSMLTEATEGLRLVNPDGNYKLENAAGADVGYTYSFENEQESVTYFASGINQSIQLSADLSQFYDQGAYVYAKVLGAADGTTGTEYWAQATTTHLTNLSLNGGIFNFTLEPFEVIELHIVSGGGISISGDQQNSVADQLRGSSFSDILEGGLGNDLLTGHDGQDILNGGAGNDILNGQRDNDTLSGGEGNDALYGANGRDHLMGGAGNDRMRGNEKMDILEGGEGSDSLFGGSESDQLFGDAGRDYLYGDEGDDLLDGGSGHDKLHGGSGADTFVFRNGDYGYDIIKDFEIGIDHIDLRDFNLNSIEDVKAIATDTGFGWKIKFGNGDVLMLQNITEDQVQASDFLL